MPGDRETTKKQYKEDLFRTKAYEEFKNSTDVFSETTVVQGAASYSSKRVGEALSDTGVSEGDRCILPSTDAPLKQRGSNSPQKHTDAGCLVGPRENAEKAPGKYCNIKSLVKNTFIRIRALVPFRNHALLRFRIPRFRAHLRHSHGAVGENGKATDQNSNKKPGFSSHEMAGECGNHDFPQLVDGPLVGAIIEEANGGKDKAQASDDHQNSVDLDSNHEKHPASDSNYTSSNKDFQDDTAICSTTLLYDGELKTSYEIKGSESSNCSLAIHRQESMIKEQDAALSKTGDSANVCEDSVEEASCGKGDHFLYGDAKDGTIADSVPSTLQGSVCDMHKSHTYDRCMDRHFGEAGALVSISADVLVQPLLDAVCDVTNAHEEVIAEKGQEHDFHSECSSSSGPGECSLAFVSESESSDTELVSSQSKTGAEVLCDDTSSVSESDLDYSYKALEFPDDREYSSDLLTRTDWELIRPILSYVQAFERIEISPLHGKEEDEAIHMHTSCIAIEEEAIQGSVSICKSGRTSGKDSLKSKKGGESSAHTDLRYLYFLKKVCNLAKKDARVYCKDQNRFLVDRGIRNMAKTPPKKRYLPEIREDGTVIYTLVCNQSVDSKARNTDSDVSDDTKWVSDVKAGRRPLGSSVALKRVSEIGDIRIPSYNRDEFGYLVYRHGDDLVSIAKGMGMDLKDVILIYYLEYGSRNLEITGSLLEKYVEEEWTITDRILFEENFMKYGTKFNKFMINKSDADLRIYYRYYLKNYMPVNWTEQERSLFSLLFSTYKKDWNLMQDNFPNKTSDDLRVFYGSYFKKLDEEERARESQLAGSEESQVKVKKRGRKSSTTKSQE